MIVFTPQSIIYGDRDEGLFYGQLHVYQKDQQSVRFQSARTTGLWCKRKQSQFRLLGVSQTPQLHAIDFSCR